MVSGLSLGGGGGELLSLGEVEGGGGMLSNTVVNILTHDMRVVTYRVILNYVIILYIVTLHNIIILYIACLLFINMEAQCRKAC